VAGAPATATNVELMAKATADWPQAVSLGKLGTSFMKNDSDIGGKHCECGNVCAGA
jgi:hypothetical protein